MSTINIRDEGFQAPTRTYIPTFGTVTGANANYFVFSPRQIQFALRFTF